MTILGIDPGKSGAVVAVLDEGGELLKVHDTPSTLEPNGRSTTNAPLLALRHALSGREAGPLRIALALIDACQARSGLLMTPQTQQGKATR